MARRLIPALNGVLVEKIVPPAKTNTGVILPGKATKVGISLCGWEPHKEGDTVLFPEYGGAEVKLNDKEYHLYRDDDILGTLHD